MQHQLVGVFEAVGMLASRAQLVMAGAELHHKTVGSVRGQSRRGKRGPAQRGSVGELIVLIVKQRSPQRLCPSRHKMVRPAASLAIMGLAVTVFFLCGTSGNCMLAEPFLSHRFPDQRADAR